MNVYSSNEYIKECFIMGFYPSITTIKKKLPKEYLKIISKENEQYYYRVRIMIAGNKILKFSSNKYKIYEPL